MLSNFVEGIQCTSMETLFKGKVVSGRRCVLKFCEACLKKKYDEDIMTIKATKRSPSKSKLHAAGEIYIFKCVFQVLIEWQLIIHYFSGARNAGVPALAASVGKLEALGRRPPHLWQTCGSANCD
jgi:hypothetical protein